MDLVWWVKPNGFKANCTASLREPQPTLHIWSDASMDGGGAHDSRGNFMQRTWTDQDLVGGTHINILELRAAKEAIAKFALRGDICCLHIDNKVAVVYISKQGGTKSSALTWEACQLWEIVQQRGTTLITPHWISTKHNSTADFLTRHNLETWEISN